MLGHLAGSLWICEQPATSLFFGTVEMTAAIRHCKADRVQFDMSSYGHDSKKPTVLVGTTGYLGAIRDKAVSLPRTTHGRLATTEYKGGKKHVTGVKDELKTSQVYPVQFALMVVRSHYGL